MGIDAVGQKMYWHKVKLARQSAKLRKLLPTAFRPPSKPVVIPTKST